MCDGWEWETAPTLKKGEKDMSEVKPETIHLLVKNLPLLVDSVFAAICEHPALGKVESEVYHSLGLLLKKELQKTDSIIRRWNRRTTTGQNAHKV